MTMPTQILFHRDCPDGFGSAWVAQKFIPGAELTPMAYGDPIPGGVDGEIVWMLDFCLEPEGLRELCARAANVRILDHHYTAVQNLDQVDEIVVYGSPDDMPEVMPEHWALINQSKSGVGLTCDWFGFDRSWLNNIEDRDLWRFELFGTAEISAAVTSRPYTIEAWDDIDAAPYGTLFSEGEAIVRYRNQLIEAAVEGHWWIHIPKIGLVPVAPCPYAIGSDVAGRLAEMSEDGVGAYFMVKANTVRFGLRARNGGPNVADLAAIYGGGGHPGASGFEVAREEFDAWCR
jgi:hypothetical protein